MPAMLSPGIVIERQFGEPPTPATVRSAFAALFVSA